MPDPRTLLPLKPLVFQVLLALADGERHGWSLVREIQQDDGGGRILPAQFLPHAARHARRRPDPEAEARPAEAERRAARISD